MKVFRFLFLGMVLVSFLNGATDSPIQREALIKLYESTNGANWKNDGNWTSNKSFCDWHGVTCEVVYVVVDGEFLPTNVVEELILDYNRLSGNIPEEIGALTFLKKLSLNGNNFPGSIPNEIGNLKNLQYLFLNKNNLIGSILEEIGKLEYLRILFLDNNNLTGEIPQSIVNLQNLEYLDLQYNCSLKTDNDEVKGFINDKTYEGYQGILNTNGNCSLNMSPIYYLLLN